MANLSKFTGIKEEEISVDDDFMPKLPQKYRIELEKNWIHWKNTVLKTRIGITDDEMREKLMFDLNWLCNMSSEEYTLYRKWLEIRREYKYDIKNASLFFADLENLPSFNELPELKRKIWTPGNIDEYKNLKPKIIWTCGVSDIDNLPLNKDAKNLKKKESSALVKEWNGYRFFLSTMINNPNIGRNLYFMVQDETSKKMLGIMALSSDFLDLTPRDGYIGWSRESKTHGKMINHTGIGSTIVPTQPLGYNYVGGKLMALLMVSSVVEDAWNEVYNTTEMPSRLAGVTTTSLYSSFSQYTNLKYWNHLGHSAGSIKFEPSVETLKWIKQWLMGYDAGDGKGPGRKYWEWYVATEPQGMPLKRDYKQRSLSFAYGKLGIDKKYYETNHARGIYFCPLFTNTKEYLRGEIKEDQLQRRFENSVEALTELWREKYASKRITKLVEENRVSYETLFYDDIIKMTWEQTREKYLKDVGR